jgi:anti-sigma regulatory factor (Ser/Thr protein kinase)
MSSSEGQTRTFRVTPAEISAADTWIEEVGRRWGLAERMAFGARVCVAEIAANVLEHGSACAEPVQLAVTLRRSNNGLDIEITVPNPPLPKTIEAAQVGGLGLRLVRFYASELTYRHDGVCNHLLLHFPAPSPEGST